MQTKNDNFEDWYYYLAQRVNLEGVKNQCTVIKSEIFADSKGAFLYACAEHTATRAALYTHQRDLQELLHWIELDLIGLDDGSLTSECHSPVNVNSF